MTENFRQAGRFTPPLGRHGKKSVSVRFFYAAVDGDNQLAGIDSSAIRCPAFHNLLGHWRLGWPTLRR